MQRGTKVCKGRFWDKIRRAPGWYMENAGGKIYLFWIRYVLCFDVDVVPYDNTTGQVPTVRGNIGVNPEVTVKCIRPHTMRELRLQKIVRSKLEHEPVVDMEDEEDDGTSEMDNDSVERVGSDNDGDGDDEDYVERRS